MSTTHIHHILPYTFNAMVTDTSGKVLEQQHVHGTKHTSHRVIYNGDTTIVILNDGSKGVAKKDPSDFYNKQVGYDIAYIRAKIESLKKGIVGIIKDPSKAKDTRVKK